MKTLVIFTSKTGFTRKYAEWIADEMKADIFDIKDVKPDVFRNYDNIVCGGGLYAAGIAGVKILKSNFDLLKNKKVVVFATGASPFRKKAVEEIIKHNFSDDERKHFKFYYLKGGFNFNKLSFGLKIIMTIMKWHLKLKRNPTPDDKDKGMLAAFKKPVDFTKKDRTKDLINYLKFKS